MSTPLVAVLDYGIGNLRSAQKALQKVGADAASRAMPHSFAMRMPRCCLVSAILALACKQCAPQVSKTSY